MSQPGLNTIGLYANVNHSAKILYVQGRQHPVTIYHTAASQPDYVDSALRTFFQIHTDRPPGDVLIFLPGQEDIENLEKSIKLYADRLPKETAGVRSVSFAAVHLFILGIGCSIPYVRSFACTPATSHIFASATRDAKVHIGHEHRGDIYHYTRDQVCR